MFTAPYLSSVKQVLNLPLPFRVLTNTLHVVFLRNKHVLVTCAVLNSAGGSGNCGGEIKAASRQ